MGHITDEKQRIERIIEKARTSQQNAALHLFFRRLADALNDAGLDQRTVLKPSIAIPWTEESCKEQLWRPVQKALLGKQSTTELSKHMDIDQVHETLMRHLGEKFGLDYIEFPSRTEGETDEKGRVVIRNY